MGQCWSCLWPDFRDKRKEDEGFLLEMNSLNCDFGLDQPSGRMPYPRRKSDESLSNQNLKYFSINDDDELPTVDVKEPRLSGYQQILNPSALAHMKQGQADRLSSPPQQERAGNVETFPMHSASAASTNVVEYSRSASREEGEQAAGQNQAVIEQIHGTYDQPPSSSVIASVTSTWKRWSSFKGLPSIYNLKGGIDLETIQSGWNRLQNSKHGSCSSIELEWENEDCLQIQNWGGYRPSHPLDSFHLGQQQLQTATVPNPTWNNSWEQQPQLQAEYNRPWGQPQLSDDNSYLLQNRSLQQLDQTNSWQYLRDASSPQQLEGVDGQACPNIRTAGGNLVMEENGNNLSWRLSTDQINHLENPQKPLGKENTSRASSENSLSWDNQNDKYFGGEDELAMGQLDHETEQLISQIEALTSAVLKETAQWTSGIDDTAMSVSSGSIDRPHEDSDLMTSSVETTGHQADGEATAGEAASLEVMSSPTEADH